jgi:sulfur relay (sulfurtransferase) DsrF/TusC family protein
LDKKKVVVLLRHSPLGSVKGSEGLRHSVGLTLANNEVTAVLMDQAVWLATPLAPELISGGEIKKHKDMLVLLKGRVLVERESLEEQEINPSRLMPGVEVVSHENVIATLTEAEAVIPF